MKGLERLVELCQKQWPNQPIAFIVYPHNTEGYRLQVKIGPYLTPGDFSEHDLTQPQAVMHTLKMMVQGVSSLIPPPGGVSQN